MKNNKKSMRHAIVSILACIASVGLTRFMEYYVSNENSIGVGLLSLLIIYPYISYRLGHFAVHNRKEAIYQSILIGAVYALLLNIAYNATAIPYAIFYCASYLVGSYVNKNFKKDKRKKIDIS